jgi:hypothetical protein
VWIREQVVGRLAPLAVAKPNGALRPDTYLHVAELDLNAGRKLARSIGKAELQSVDAVPDTYQAAEERKADGTLANGEVEPRDISPDAAVA